MQPRSNNKLKLPPTANMNNNQFNSPSSILDAQNQLKITQFKQSLSKLPDLQTIYFQDQSKYYGQVIQNQIRQGIGFFQIINGDKYLGDWFNDKYHGYGVYICADGERYEGELEEGEKQGQGTYFYLDGTVYEGQWVDGLKEGQGIETYSNNSTQYIGEWRQDKKQGYGKLVTLNSTYYINTNESIPPILQGIWQNDEFSSGKITTQHYQGQYRNHSINGNGVYTGSFFDGEKHGTGIYYYSNGDVYEGEFKRGLKNGRGVYKYFTGDVYEGMYYNDLKWGEGKFLFVNGNQYVGEFQRDCFHGKGKYFFNKTEFLAGYFENGMISQNQNYVQNIQFNSDIKKGKSPNVKTGGQGSRTSRDHLSPSHLLFSPSVPQFTADRGAKSPRTMAINSNRQKFNTSPIRDSKFLQVHLPSDSYFEKNPSVLNHTNNFAIRNTPKNETNFNSPFFQKSNQQNQQEMQNQIKNNIKNQNKTNLFAFMNPQNSQGAILTNGHSSNDNYDNQNLNKHAQKVKSSNNIIPSNKKAKKKFQQHR